MGGIGLGIAAAIAFGTAAVLAFYEKEGWGWLIFAGIIACSCATAFAASRAT